MNKSLALSILSIHEDHLNEIEDCVEELIFPIKNKIIARPNLPRVIEVHVKRLNKILDAYVFLTALNVEIEPKKIALNSHGSYKIVFDNYNIQYAQLISKVMNASDISELISSSELLLFVQNQWIEYNFNFSVEFISDFKSEVNTTLGAIHDPVALVNGVDIFVNKLKSSETILKKYTFEQLDSNMQILIKEWIRLNQYHEQYG